MRAPLIFLACLLPLLAASCDDTSSPAAPSAPAAGTTVTATASDTPRSATPAVSPPDGLTLATVTRVVDGDTIHVEIDGQDYPLRYIGIDTPETVDPRRPVGCYGAEASDRNKALVEDKQVGLERDVSETDQFGRLLRYVWLLGEDGAPTEMVNASLVRDGYAQAVTYPPDVRYQDTFLELQREAREAGRGLWGDVCVSPTASAPPAAFAGPICDYSGTSEPVVKGNISQNSGEKIFHVPGQKYYEATVINEAKGERWFCTEQEAIAAGWRKAKV